MGKIICISSQKGGVGKTITAVNLSTALAIAEKKTLLLDMDFQGHATGAITAEGKKGEKGIYDALTRTIPVAETIKGSEIEYLKLIPADIRLLGVEHDLRSHNDREHILDRLLNDIRKEFDFIIIDSPPSFSFLSVNGIIAADFLVLPLQCEYFALESLGQFFTVFRGLKKKYKARTEIGGILLNMFDPHEALSVRIAGEVMKSFNGMVYRSVIPRCRGIKESACHGKSIILTDISSDGSKGFISLAREIIGTMYCNEE
ncbi:MAG: ParA family protein [Deltaproteobacteria bacterium]|nr:ParA family protein [Deltaproteobacteria bacterium]